MWRVAIRLALQLLLIVAAMITGTPLLQWLKILQEIGPNRAEVHLAGLKVLEGNLDLVTLQMRLVISLAAVVGLLLYEAYDLVAPRVKLRDFRQAWLEDLWEKEWSKLFGDLIRVNIMKSRRLWCFPFVKRFVWTWNKHFDREGQHRDSGLFLTTLQGACGQAYRREEPIYLDLRRGEPQECSWFRRWFSQPHFGLLPWQLRKTAHVKAILSIPVLLKKHNREGNSSFRPVGVINIDATTEEDADYLAAEERKLARYFRDFGIVLAPLLRL